MKRVFFALTALIGFNISVSYGQDVAQDRIFKGWFLSPHEFPWMVKLKVRNTLPKLKLMKRSPLFFYS